MNFCLWEELLELAFGKKIGLLPVTFLAPAESKMAIEGSSYSFRKELKKW